MSTVSVIVATYKREQELKQALISLCNQDYKDFEIVLVDDNGQEEWNAKVKDIVDAVQAEYPNVPLQYIVNSPNQGSAKTRNIGIEKANGEYVTFLDDDDIYLPSKITNQVTFMQENNLDYSITDLDLFNQEEKLVDKRTRSYIKETSTEALRVYHLKYHITGTDTMMFKKEYLDAIGGFAPIDVGDEFYLMQRAIEGAGKFGYLPKCDVKAYIHTGENAGVSSGQGKIDGENALYEYKKRFFDKLSKRDVRYIKMRHNAVLAFANVRMKKYFMFLILGIKSFLCSPIQSVVLILKRNDI